MGDMDDPLQKFVEKYFDQMYQDATEQFPHRSSEEIDAFMMRPELMKESGGTRTKGVKASKGRPPTNKSILAGWMLLLVQIVSNAEFYSQVVNQKKTASPKLFPSRQRSFNRITELGLAYSIAEGSNPIKYPLTSAPTLKRHYTFASSKDIDIADANAAILRLSQHLSFYLESPPQWDAYYFQQRGYDAANYLCGWRYTLSLHELKTEMWRRNFQASAKDVESGPQMTLHFPPLKESAWLSLKAGYAIRGFLQMEKFKNNPPSKEEIAVYREFRRNNPEKDYQKLLSK